MSSTLIINPFVLGPPGEALLYAVDMARTSGGVVDGYTDETAAGFTVSGESGRFNNSDGNVVRLGLYNPAPVAVYRNTLYSSNASMTVTIPGLTPGTPYLIRTHHWGDSDISATFTMTLEADGVEQWSQAFNTALPGAVIKEFVITPAGSSVVLELFKDAVIIMLNGIEVISNPVMPRPVLPNVVGYGDSIMWGSDASDQYRKNPTYQLWEMLLADGQWWSHSNVAVAGHRIQTMNDDGGGQDYGALVAPLYNEDAPHNILLLNGGVNDLFNGRTVAELKADFIALVDQAQADGWKVAVTSLPIWGDSYTETRPAGYNDDRDEMNAWIEAGNSGADHYMDVASDAWLGDAGDADDTTYIADGLHYNDDGYERWAELFMMPAIAALT